MPLNTTDRSLVGIIGSTAGIIGFLLLLIVNYITITMKIGDFWENVFSLIGVLLGCVLLLCGFIIYGAMTKHFARPKLIAFCALSIGIIGFSPVIFFIGVITRLVGATWEKEFFTSVISGLSLLTGSVIFSAIHLYKVRLYGGLCNYYTISLGILLLLLMAYIFFVCFLWGFLTGHALDGLVPLTN